VTKSRRDVPDVLSMLWVCQYAPDLSAYVPMYVQSERLSRAWITGSALVRDLAAFCFATSTQLACLIIVCIRLRECVCV
jgi:hypothetical protein